MLRTSWHEGSATATTGPLLVSVTDFTAATARDLPGIARAGLRLRRALLEVEGAVGLWLWAEPLARRTGSVSVWTGEKSLHEFVRLPEHVGIMRKYRGRGEIRAVTWQAEHLDVPGIWRDAYRLLSKQRSPGPSGTPDPVRRSGRIRRS